MSAGANLMPAVASSERLWGGIGHLPPESIIFGRSAAMQSLSRKLSAVAVANIPVLIDGESGTGKEIIAKMIHQMSPWSNGPFAKVNCPAIPGTLVESELFGYEKGAFTGANVNKPGRIELAHRGTLFLDEIGEMDLGLQAKLLQVLQHGEFCKIGGQQNQRVEVRVVCATNRDLAAEVEQGRFRADLLYRINVLVLSMPPLRERKEDILILANYLLSVFREKFKVNPLPLTKAAQSLLEAYSWPGNIRELENVMKRYAILGSLDMDIKDDSHAAQSMADFDPAGSDVSLKQITKRAVRAIEKEAIFKTLQATAWNRKEAARRLRISYRALIYKIQEAGLQSSKD